MYMECSKALVCCGHNVLCLDLIFTCSLSDNYIPCTNTGSLGDRVEFCFTLLSVDFAFWTTKLVSYYLKYSSDSVVLSWLLS